MYCSCQKLLNAIELINPRCSACGGAPVKQATEHLFLDLPRLHDPLTTFFEKTSVEGGWSKNGVAITRDWLQRGLQPRCITRDLKWGTPVPKEGFTDKVFYVWFDAPIGYLSITAKEMPNDWKKWWQGGDDVKLYQFIGKDNVPFHSIIFPASCMATGDPYVLVNTLSTTEYLQYEAGLKFSKSKNTGVFGDQVASTRIPPEVWRYYLLSTRPESADTEFNWDDVLARTNGELLANLGNFVNRLLAFVSTKLGGIVPAVGM